MFTGVENNLLKQVSYKKKPILYSHKKVRTVQRVGAKGIEILTKNVKI